MKLMKSVVPVLLLFCFPSAVGAVPNGIPYSGQLSENGTLVTGSRDLTIAVYADSTGGAAIYTETFTRVNLQNGIYHFNLNPDQSVWDGSVRWLGVSVNGGAELTPRTKIGSVPYAVRAGTADAVANAPLLPGASFRYSGSEQGAFDVTSILWVVVDSITVTCPADGFLFMSASGSVILDASSRYLGRLRIQEGTPSDFDGGYLLGAASSGIDWQYIPVSIAQMQPIVQGPHTISVWAKKENLTDQNYRYRRHAIQVLWFPNRYQ
ncbi:MAG: hypothetical protein HYY50_01040 [Candidatus Kerfeldbacteria bacterium]|nr:hypothetical protein [Candidatus Kerfeldbacteria bacterium]